jgi:hypothetical protein
MRRPAELKEAKYGAARLYLLAGLVVVALLLVGGRGFRHFCSDLQKYCNIRSTDNRSEVLYRLGFPPAVLDDSQKDSLYPGRRSYKTNRDAAAQDPDNAMPVGKTVADFYEWSYPLRDATDARANMYVDFDRATKIVEHIDCVDFTDVQHLCGPLAGIGVGDTEEHVKERLGKPDRYQLDGATKTLSYDGVGIEYRLTKGRVYYLRLSRTESRNPIQLLNLYLRDVFS